MTHLGRGLFRRYRLFRRSTRRTTITVGTGLSPYRHLDPWLLNAPAPKIFIPGQRRSAD